MIDLNCVPNYSDAQILQVLRMSLVNAAFATNYTMNGKVVGQMSGAEIQKLIGEYEWRIARANNGLFVVAQNRDPE